MSWQPLNDPSLHGLTVKHIANGVVIRCTCYTATGRRWQIIAPDLRTARQQTGHRCVYATHEDMTRERARHRRYHTDSEEAVLR